MELVKLLVILAFAALLVYQFINRNSAGQEQSPKQNPHKSIEEQVRERGYAVSDGDGEEFIGWHTMQKITDEQYQHHEYKEKGQCNTTNQK